MKVVMVSDYTVEKPFGGLQTHVYYLAKHLSQFKDLELHIITFSDEKVDMTIDNIHFHFIKTPEIPRLFTIFQNNRTIKNKINEINPDIVHVHGTHYPYGLVAGAIANTYPTLLTVHGIMSMEYKYNRGLNYLGALVSVLLEKYAFSKVKNMIVCSQPIKDLLIGKTIAEISIIPNGVECDYIENITYLKPVKPHSIIFMGLLEKIKGIDVLIKSIPLIKQEIPDIMLYIAGEGSQETLLKKMVNELDIQENVEFLGYLQGQEKFSYFKSVDICAVPSRYESFGITILESMACGKPVIASNIGNIPSLVNKDTGILFESENKDDLSQKIIKLINNRDLQVEMGLNAEKRIKEYDWNKIALETKRIYTKLINSKIQ